MPTLYITADPRSWLTTSYQLTSLLCGPWLCSPGSKGRRSSSSGLPRVQENLLGHQAAASQGKRSAIAYRPSHCPRALRTATTSHSPHHSPHRSLMVTSGTGRRAEKAIHHSRDMVSLPWWNMKWYGTCLPCWGLRATWCLWSRGTNTTITMNTTTTITTTTSTHPSTQTSTLPTRPQGHTAGADVCPVESTAFPGPIPSRRCQVGTGEMAPGWVSWTKPSFSMPSGYQNI